jgi:hypothetical protein
MISVNDDWKQHVTLPDQFVGTRVVRVIDGSGDGARLLQAWTPSGLEVDIALDRGFDIVTARLRGVPVAWLGASGPQPRYMQEPPGYGWLRTFQGGLVTTCGLSHIGSPAELSNQHNLPPHNEDVHHGEHGRYTHQSAQLTGCVITDDDDPAIVLSATIRESSLYSESFELKRQIDLPLYRSDITIRDSVTNIGALPARHELLYHVNLGHPLVSEDAIVHATSGASVRTERIAAPTPIATESVDAWSVDPADDGLATVYLSSPSFGGGLAYSYSVASLPEFLLWKLQRTKSNVVGFAPQSQPGAFLQPGETTEYLTRFSFTMENEDRR